MAHTRYQSWIDHCPYDWGIVQLRSLKPQIEYGTNQVSNGHGAGVPVIGIPQVLSSRFVLSELPCADVTNQERESLALRAHDVLLVRTNGNPSYIGRSTVIPEGTLDTLTVFASYLIRVRLDQRQMRGAFFNYILQSENGRRQSSALANTSAGNFNLGARALSQFTLPLPTPEEQDAIIKAIDAADDEVIALEEQIRKAERVKKALMQNAFPYESDSTGLPTIKGLIVAPVTNGYSPVCPGYETGRWVLGLDALTVHGFNPEGRKPAPNDDPKLLGNELQDNDILISRSNTRERVGYAGLYEGNPTPCFYPDLMMRVRVDHAKIRPRYLDLLLQSEFARRFFQSRAGGTSGSMVKIKERDVRQMPVILPCGDEQDIVVERFKAGAILIAALRTQITAARRVKQSLLQNLLTGKIRLKP